MSNVTSVSVRIGDGELVFETGKIAERAHYDADAVVAQHLENAQQGSAAVFHENG